MMEWQDDGGRRVQLSLVAVRSFASLRAMLRVITVWLALALAGVAAERQFDFSLTNENRLPEGFRSTVSGAGKPGEWQIVLEDAPSALPAFSQKSPIAAKRSVLAQLSRDPTDEHFPLLVFEEEKYGDFTFKVRVKTVDGQVERMAGIAFRLQDEKNYYVVRISSLGNNLRFYKFVNGVRSTPIGPELPVPSGVWHELSVQCKGNQILVSLNGQPAIPPLSDPSFAAGKIALWTKSDSVSYFAEPRLAYQPLEKLADTLVQATLTKFSKLRGLKLYVIPSAGTEPVVIAGSNRADIGQVGGRDEMGCLKEGTTYMGKGKGTVAVLLPLRDRNGDIAAAVRVTLDSSLIPTQEHALTRVRPVVRFIEGRINASSEKLQ
jgi:hypothetical protein